MYQIRKCSKLYVPNSKLLKNATSIIIASNFLMFPVSLLQLNSKNIDTLMQKLSENETQNTVSKLKFLSLLFYVVHLKMATSWDHTISGDSGKVGAFVVYHHKLFYS